MTRYLLAWVVTAALVVGCGPSQEEQNVNQFIQDHVATVKPLMREANLAYWQAATSGDKEAYERYAELELKIRQVYSDSTDFKILEQFKQSETIEDPLLTRQIEVLYNSYLENQIDPKLLKDIVNLSAGVQQTFSTFRGRIDGKAVTSNTIEDILKKETDSRKRRDAWLASKQVGPRVSDDLIELVKLRNKAARKLGFDSYHTLSLKTSEQDVATLDSLFNGLYELTNEPYAELKAELDSILAYRYGIRVAGLMPWHYHDSFFQETPLVYDLDLDAYYEDHDVKALAADFYAGISLPVDSILTHSDLYEREGKNPHAFCTDIDREGDVRILCNLKNNERWMETMLHELGHAVYDKYMDPDLPFLLREPAHAFTTEAVAMFFGRLSRDPDWMQEMLDLSDVQRKEIETVSEKYARLKQLIFARWAMVMYEFEKQLYQNPDQDLNGLWWDLKSKYQMLAPPPGRNQPDWASKIHFAIAPCYYHNYLLGELLASQLHHTLALEVLHQENAKQVSYVDQRPVGIFLRRKVFETGDRFHWNEMIKRATGEYLTPTFFVEQFVR